MELTVTVRRDPQSPFAPGRFRERAPGALKKATAAAIEIVEREAKRTTAEELRPGRNGESGYAASFEPRAEVLGLTFEGALENTAPYAEFVERGRGPGKPPPFEPIREYVFAHGDQDRASRRPTEADQSGPSADFVTRYINSIRFGIAHRGTRGHGIADKTQRRVSRVELLAAFRETFAVVVFKREG